MPFSILRLELVVDALTTTKFSVLLEGLAILTAVATDSSKPFYVIN
jgi:hypothetical protein